MIFVYKDLSKYVESEPVLTDVDKKADQKEKNMLICALYDFYS